MNARWKQDSDRWVWRIYDGERVGAVTPENGENVADIYIVPLKDEWWIVSAKTVMENSGRDWIERVGKGEGVRIAGPFGDLISAKAAWRLMYG